MSRWFFCIVVTALLHHLRIWVCLVSQNRCQWRHLLDLKIKLEPERGEAVLRMAIALLLFKCSRCIAEDLWIRLAPQGFGAEPSCTVYKAEYNTASTLSKPLRGLWRPMWRSPWKDSSPWGLCIWSIWRNAWLQQWRGAEVHKVRYCFCVQDVLCWVICMHQAVT